MHAGANTPAETGRCVRRSLPSRSAAFPLLPEGRVRRWRGARRVRCVGPLTFAVVLSPAPIGPFPPPALRTGRADLPHPALQWDHASRTRNASSEPLPAIAGHSRYRWPCVPPAPRSCTASPAVPLAPTRRQACSRPDGTELQSVSPAPSLTHVMLRNSPPFHAGFIGKATPAGLRPSDILPHLRPLSSTGITPRLQSYGPLRHPAGPACPSRGFRLPRARHRHGLPVLLRFPSSTRADATAPAETGGALVTLFPPVNGLPLANGGFASALCVSRPSRRSLTFRPAWSLSRLPT